MLLSAIARPLSVRSAHIFSKQQWSHSRHHIQNCRSARIRLQRCNPALCNISLGLARSLSLLTDERQRRILARIPGTRTYRYQVFVELLLPSLLGGLRWHLSGLSELPPRQRLLLLHSGEYFSFFIQVLEQPDFPFLCFLWAFSLCTMYDHVVFEHLVLYCSTASTAQHSTAERNQPVQKPQSKYVPIRARQRQQADRVGESQHMSSSICTAR